MSKTTKYILKYSTSILKTGMAMTRKDTGTFVMIDLSRFIPELVELDIVRDEHLVAELAKHRVEDLIIRIEMIVSIRPPEPQLHAQASVHSQTQKTRIRWT